MKGIIRQQAIPWANVDAEVYRYIVLLGYNNLTKLTLKLIYEWVTTAQRKLSMKLLMHA